MKLKAGNPAKLKNLKYEGYKALAKKTFTELATSGLVSPFIVIKGEQVEFKTGKKDTDHLLYIGDIKDWKKVISKEGWKKHCFSYGFCRVLTTKKGVEVELKVNKGTLALKPAEFKPIVKQFATKFKPKAFISVVPELEGAPENTESDDNETPVVQLNSDDLIAAFKMFKSTELALFKAEKTKDNAEDLITKANEINRQIDSYLEENSSNKNIDTIKEGLNKTVTQVSAFLAKLTGGAGNSQEGTDFEKVNSRLNQSIDNLLNNFADEIDSLGLQKVLESVKSA